MNLAEQELNNQFSGKSWFHSVGEDEYGRCVVYVNYMNAETLLVPDQVQGKQILVHFANYLNATKNNFADEIILAKPSAPASSTDVMSSLNEDIFSLKRMCGIDNLIDLLYEVHESNLGKSMFLTNVSSEFPEARQHMEDLYDDYGFDAIYARIEQ